VPYTGRQQISLVSEAEERQQGEQLYAVAKRRAPVSQDTVALAIVQDVGRRIAAVSGQPAWDWEFTLFDEPDEVNAWALPGGKVGIYTGLLPIAHDEAGLASVIGHEVAHAIAHHGAERASQGQLIQLLGAGVAVAAGGTMGSGAANALMQAYGVGAQVGVMLPFGRAQESEADEIGLILMAKAGYDPRAAIAVWQRMGTAEGAGSAPPEFLSTHPSYGTRIERIRAALPRALEYYEPGRAPNRTLPALAALEGANPSERAIFDSVVRIDQLAAKAEDAAVATAIGAEFDQRPEAVVTYANQSALSPGEAALALAVLRDTKVAPERLARDLQGGAGWWRIIRDTGASPRALVIDLGSVAKRLSSTRRR